MGDEYGSLTAMAPTHRTKVELSQPVPAEVGAGTAITLKVRVSCSADCDLGGGSLQVLAEDGVVVTDANHKPQYPRPSRRNRAARPSESVLVPTVGTSPDSSRDVRIIRTSSSEHPIARAIRTLFQSVFRCRYHSTAGRGLTAFLSTLSRTTYETFSSSPTTLPRASVLGGGNVSGLERLTCPSQQPVR